MTRRLIIGELDGAVTACVLEDGETVEILSGSELKPQLCGSIYLGRVTNLKPGLSAAFIDIGLERTALLSGENELRAPIKTGDEIPVQITKLPGGDKGVVVSRDIKLAGRYCVYMPLSEGVGVSKRIDDADECERLRNIALKAKSPGSGLIMRTNAREADDETILKDIETLKTEWESILQRAGHLKAPALLRDESGIVYRAARDIFCKDFSEVEISSKKLYNEFSDCVSVFSPSLMDRIKLSDKSDMFTAYRVRAALDRAKKRKVLLDCGGSIVIDRTEAMTVIDVNSGAYTGTDSVRDTLLKVNLEAAKEIAKQLRLRDIGGIIVVDFIDMADKNDRLTLMGALGRFFESDRGSARVIDMTQLGLIEITRKKKYESGI